MSRQKFEKLSNKEQELRWDTRAHQFNKNQLCEVQVIPEAIVDYISEHYGEVRTVLDIGGGSGRYALLFGAKMERVLMTDISSNMLSYARQNAENKGLTNIEFAKMDWVNDKSSKTIESKYDLVFSSMCPATRSQEGIAQMMHVSGQYCAVNQYILAEDSLKSFIQKCVEEEYQKQGKRIEPRRDPHNDRPFVQELFMDLWSSGYLPEIKLFSEQKNIELTAEKAREKYLDIEHTDPEEHAIRSEAIERFSQNGVCQIVKKNITALIIWKVEKE